MSHITTSLGFAYSSAVLILIPLPSGILLPFFFIRKLHVFLRVSLRE
jgi:hypothetical protein